MNCCGFLCVPLGGVSRVWYECCICGKVFRKRDETAVEEGDKSNPPGDVGRFWAALKGIVGRRLTYRRLCMIGDCGFMGIT